MLAASTLSVCANARVVPRLPARSIRGARAASARLPIRASSSTGGQRHVATPRASDAQKADRRGDKLPMRASSEDGYALDNAQGLTFVDKAKRWIDDNSVEVNAALNVLIVGSVAFGAVFQIVEVDSDISKGWTAWEILRNIPRDNLEAYQQSVFNNPLPTKALTSGVAYTLGDFTCQLSQGKKITTVDLKRSLRSGIAGFLIHGPMCHYWLQWTEENLSFDGALWAIPVKVVADQTVWSLFLNSAYTTCIMSLQGMGPERIKGEIQATWWNALSAGWRFWPFVHSLTFSPIIPQDFKLLFVDCVEVVWVTILSAAVNRDSEKALQVPLNAEAERPGVQLTEQMDSQFASVVDGVETQFDPAKLPSNVSGSFEELPAGDTCLIGGEGGDDNPRSAWPRRSAWPARSAWPRVTESFDSGDFIEGAAEEREKADVV
mmetsp:Transcript_11890/g.51198  ORF Transcript_11890/g.51198 Transcript_11890/m.51198 type:complete len:434 (-) Transcript_11890:857-2158(-)